MKSKYPVLTGEIERRKIPPTQIADCLGTSGRRLRQKLRGGVPFTWTEVTAIHKRFFPELSMDELFLSEGAAESELFARGSGAAMAGCVFSGHCLEEVQNEKRLCG